MAAPDWLRRFWAWLKKEFWSWGIKAIFSAVLAGIISAFYRMEWQQILLLVVCVPLAIITGWKIVQGFVRDIRKTAPKQTKPVDPEFLRRKEVRKMFQALIAEAENVGVYWDDRQVDQWVAKVAATMQPLFPEADVESFVKLYGNKYDPRAMIDPFDTKVLPNERRMQCCAWLNAACLKYWLI
jgi:hypothetical protein